jgi:putative toxin-antitoxin system antitoxin component (TIGR02293 family)
MANTDARGGARALLPPKKTSGTVVKAVPAKKTADGGYWSMLGIKDRSPGGIKKAIAAGLPFTAINKLQSAYAINFEELAAMLQVSSRTLVRRKIGGTLDPAVSDRAIRLIRVYSLARDLFEGDEEAAREWIKRKNRSLDDFSPETMIGTETGASLVEDLIGRLENGVFS